jgi:hypothetical protein
LLPLTLAHGCSWPADYKSHVVVMDRSRVARHYACTWFLPDLISSFPYEWLPDTWPGLLVMLKVRGSVSHTPGGTQEGEQATGCC